METLLRPTTAETKQINAQRKVVATNMALAGKPEAKLQAMPGPCSTDMNRLASGVLATVHHNKRLAVVGKAATSSLVVVRYVAEKPRTHTGFTGIIHEPGGAKAYLEGARQLHRSGVPFASEVMSDAGAEIVVPHLTAGWVGAREVSATGPRYAVRPTNRDLEAGIHPLPVWVKNDQDGDLIHTINAITTIRSEKPQTRTRFGMNGMEELITYGNPHVGVILRGRDIRPEGDTQEILAEEIGSARERLDSEFGKDVVPVGVDLSHAHAKYEGGGETGQLAMAEALGNVMLMSRVDAWMAETYVLPDKQPNDGIIAGLSITDPCIRQEYAEDLMLDMDRGWDASLRNLLDIEEVVRV